MKRNFALIPIAAMTGGLCAPVFAQNADRAEIVKQADAARDAKNWADAEKLYSRAITLDPKETNAWLNRGYVRGQRGDNDGAIADVSSGLVALALSSAPGVRLRAIGFANRSAYWLQKGDPRRALVDSVIACKADETFPSAWLNRADAQYALGNLEQANICLERVRSNKGSATRDFTAEGARQNALKNKPLDEASYAPASFDAAYKAQNEGKNDEALAAYSAILEKSPFIRNAWGNRGNIHFNAKRFDDALADYAMAISLSGLDTNTEDQSRNLTNRANLYTRLGRHAEAVNDLELAVKIKPDYALAVERLKTARETLAAMPSETLPAIERARQYFAAAQKAGFFSDQAPRSAGKKVLDDLLSAEPNNIAALVLRGRFEDLGRLGGASKEGMALFERALAAGPHDPDALYEHALALTGGFSVSKENRAQSLKELKEAVARGRTDVAARRQLAEALRGSDDAGAEAQLTLALKDEPQNPDLLRERAAARRARSDFSGSVADWTTILGIKPDASNYSSRGEAYLAGKKYAEAIADLNKAVSLQPDNMDYVAIRAKAKRLSGDRVGALADYQNAHASDPTLPAVKSDLSDAEKADEAVHDFKRLMGKLADNSKKLVDSSTAVINASRRKTKLEARLRRLLNGDDRTDAQILKDFDSDKAADALDEEDYYDHARVVFRQKDIDQAIADCTKAISLKKDFDKAYNLRGVCYENKKDYEKAFADYDRAVSLVPGATYLRNRGDMHYALKRYDDAWADYDKAVADDPKDAVNYFKRGNASFQRSKYDEAIADYTKALEIDPKLTAAEKNREVARRRKGSG